MNACQKIDLIRIIFFLYRQVLHNDIASTIMNTCILNMRETKWLLDYQIYIYLDEVILCVKVPNLHPGRIETSRQIFRFCLESSSSSLQECWKWQVQDGI